MMKGIYDCLASSTWDQEVILINLSADSLPSASGPGRLLWALIWPQSMVIWFDEWHLEFVRTEFLLDSY